MRPAAGTSWLQPVPSASALSLDGLEPPPTTASAPAVEPDPFGLAQYGAGGKRWWGKRSRRAASAAAAAQDRGGKLVVGVWGVGWGGVCVCVWWVWMGKGDGYSSLWLTDMIQ